MIRFLAHTQGQQGLAKRVVDLCGRRCVLRSFALQLRGAGRPQGLVMGGAVSRSASLERVGPPT